LCTGGVDRRSANPLGRIAVPSRNRPANVWGLLAALGLTTVILNPAAAQGPAVSAKQFPTGYFYRHHKAPLQEKEQLLARIDATLARLNGEKLGLIAKGAVIEKPGTDKKTYDRVTILDESGLLITVRKVPNLYYRYAGPAPLNPNLFLVVRHARVNWAESYIRGGYVVEGDFAAYAHKFVTAIMENLEAAAGREVERPKDR
jgi:hypothetical protein